MDNDASAREKVWKHIEEIGTCMLVTTAGGAIRARPMRGLPRARDNAIWFFTDKQSPKEREAAHDPSACLAFSDIGSQTYVSVSGRLTPVDDRGKIAELWNPAVAAWYPKGQDDPALTLLKFEPEAGEYWDAPSSPIKLAIAFMHAKETRERPEVGSSGSTTMR